MTTFLQQAIRRGLYLLVIAALTLTACDDDSLVSPDPPADDLFTNYVALGNSITAGFQSDGINVQTQQASYAVLLSQAMGTPFTVPELNLPGCPPPLTNILTGERLGGPQAPECALRATPPPRRINNVAVPGAAVWDALSNLDRGDRESNANTLTTLILGGRTQVERAAEVNPTFASVWLGNNDVLGAALQGNAELITSTNNFESDYTEVLDQLSGANDLSGVLIGVVDVTLIPNLSRGAAYANVIPAAQQLEELPPNLEVAGSCGPAEFGFETLIPFRYGATLIQVAEQLFEDLGQNAPTLTIDCEEDRTVEETIGAAFGGVENIPPGISGAIEEVSGISILTADEIEAIGEAVVSFNSFIQATAQDRGWAYVNPNGLLEERSEDIPQFPELFENPNTPFSPDEPFGPFFSLDGVHPSSAAHELVAAEVAEAINATYGTSLAP